MQIANGTWVMVADGARFLLFRNTGEAQKPVLLTLLHEDIANPPSREQGSDTPGRSFSSNDNRRSSYAETDWHRQTKERFAAHTADILNTTVAQDTGEIVVIAPPQTLGGLRKHYGAGVMHRLRAEIPKDLAGHTTDDIVNTILAHAPRPQQEITP
jgi:protein required for attachment to host cells